MGSQWGTAEEGPDRRLEANHQSRHLVMTARHMGYNVLAGSEVGTGVSSLQHGRPIEAFEPWPQVRACEL